MDGFIPPQTFLMNTVHDEWVMVKSSDRNSEVAPHVDELEIPTDESVYSVDSQFGRAEAPFATPDVDHDALENLVIHFVYELARLKNENESLRRELERRFYGQSELLLGLTRALAKLTEPPLLSTSDTIDLKIHSVPSSDRAVILQKLPPISPQFGCIATEGRLQLGNLVGAAYYPDRHALDWENKLRE